MSNFGTTDFNDQVAIGAVDGFKVWNKFGYNLDVDIGTEVVAEFGGTFTPMAAAETMSVVSTDANDTSGGTGATAVLISGVANDYTPLEELVFLNGVTPVLSVGSFRAINRVVIYLAGSLGANAGRITVTSSSGAVIQASIPAGDGTTQQCIFTTTDTSSMLIKSLYINALRQAGGIDPVLTIRGLVYSDVSKTTYEVFRTLLDTGVENHVTFAQEIPFVVGIKSTIWFVCTTDKDDTDVNMRFSFLESGL
jgi:hypothetical protein